MADTLSARFRVYIGGVLADEATVPWEDFADVADIAERQSALCAQAETADRPYLVEVCFSDGEHVRWGTDAGGMVIPVEVGMGRLAEAIMARYAP